MLFISLRDTVFHALDCGNLVRALQEERASVLLNTFLLDSENRDSKGKSKTKETNLVKNNKIDDNKNGNENAFKSTSQNITRNCDIKELSLTLSLAERLVRVNDFILEWNYRYCSIKPRGLLNSYCFYLSVLLEQMPLWWTCLVGLLDLEEKMMPSFLIPFFPSISGHVERFTSVMVFLEQNLEKRMNWTFLRFLIGGFLNNL